MRRLDASFRAPLLLRQTGFGCLTLLGFIAVWCIASRADAGDVSIALNFQGSSLADANFFPPDTMGAVGPNHVVELINGRFAVYSKADGALVRHSTLDQFWSTAGATPTGFAFDPRILYDAETSRWYAVAVDNRRAANHFLVGVSSSADPTQPWSAFALESDPGDHAQWADFPTLGFNRDNVYIAANMPSIAPGNSGTISLIQIPKTSLVTSPPTLNGHVLHENIDDVGVSAQPFVDHDDSNRAMMALSTSPLVPSPFFYVLQAAPSGANPPLEYVSYPEILAYGPPPSAPQPAIGGAQKRNLDTRSDNFSGNVVLQNDHLWAVQSINVDGRAAIRWFDVRASDGQIAQSGILADPQLSFYYPSIAVNETGEVVIGASGSSTSQPVSSYAFVGETVAGATSFDAPLLLRAGVDDYQRLDGSNRNRWGDYSATVVDPSDPHAFWTFQEFVSGDDQWAIQITKLVVNSETSLVGDLDGDNDVDRDDVVLLMNQFGDHSGLPPASGDLDADGHVGVTDLAIMQGALGLTSGAPSVSVCEPTGAVPALTAMLLAAWRRRAVRRYNLPKVAA